MGHLQSQKRTSQHKFAHRTFWIVGKGSEVARTSGSCDCIMSRIPPSHLLETQCVYTEVLPENLDTVASAVDKCEIGICYLK